jgi:AGCS family alanine or glycine:cation symporter
VLADIMSSAFGLKPAIGGGLGAAVVFGVKRGLFSNEAGLGSAPNVAAVAYVKHPVEQGIIQAFSVFIDTIVLCSCTAFLILVTPLYQPGSNTMGVTLTQQSMGYSLGWSWRECAELLQRFQPETLQCTTVHHPCADHLGS